MHPILLKAGVFTFYSYGFMVALGFLFAILLAIKIAKRVNIDAEKILDASLFALIGAIIGARTAYVIFYWYELKSPWEAFMVWHGGLVFYGGLVAAILAVILAAKMLKLNALDMLDVAAPATALGYALGRIGCFLNGCCYGGPCSLPWAVHPTQIYSSLAGLIMLALLLQVFYKRKFPGQVFALGITAYSIYRFIIEYFRVNPAVFMGLNSAQIFSLLLFVTGSVLYAVFNRSKRPQ